MFGMGPMEMFLALVVVLLLFGAKRIPEIAEVVGIVTDCGGIEYARRKGQDFADVAEAALAPVPRSPARDALAGALRYVLDRRS